MRLTAAGQQQPPQPLKQLWRQLAADGVAEIAPPVEQTATPGLADSGVAEVHPGATFAIGDVQVKVARTHHQPVEPTVAFRLEHDGKSVVLGGDGIPCDTLDEICAGADAYVQTVIREDLVKLVPNKRFLDILDYHSTVEQAAQTATKAGIKKLILTHYVPSMQPGQEEEWRAFAAKYFDGEIVLGDDLTTTTI